MSFSTLRNSRATTATIELILRHFQLLPPCPWLPLNAHLLPGSQEEKRVGLGYPIQTSNWGSMMEQNRECMEWKICTVVHTPFIAAQEDSASKKPQPSSLFGTTEYVLLSQVILFASQRRRRDLDWKLEDVQTQQRTKNLSQPTFSALMQWQSGERIERIIKAQ